MSNSQSPSQDKYSDFHNPPHNAKRRTARKKKAQLEQSTLTKPQNEKQTLLTKFCRKATSTQTNSSSPKSEQFLHSQSNSRIHELEQDVRRKDEQIMKLQSEKEKEQTKLATISSEYNFLMNKTREVMVKSSRQLAELKRKEKGAICSKMGYFADSNCTQFVQGAYLSQLKAELAQSDENLSDLLKKSKNSNQQSEKDMIRCRAQFTKKQVNQLKDELAMRQKQLLKYKQKLKLRIKQQRCQMSKQNWPLLKNRYLPTDLIGSGGFGEVYKAFDFQKFTEVALKISLPDPRLSHSAQENLIKHLKREVTTHKQLQHPNIVRVIDQLEVDNGRFGFVMEYCSGPELKSYIKKTGCLDERQARNIVRQLIYAVKYLHQQKMKIVHFDLKPANVLFHNGVVKIVDFGICKLIESQETKIELTSPGIGTYWYLPPQVFDEEKAHVSSKVDIWSIGVIFFQMLYGEKPFGNGLTQAKILRQGVILSAFKVQFPVDTPKKYKVSSQAKEFIRACLKYNPDERLSPLQAFEHEYVKQ